MSFSLSKSTKCLWNY